MTSVVDSRYQEPLTHAEIFYELVQRQIPSQRENWDNQPGGEGIFGLTEGLEVEAGTFAECAQACDTNQKCFQYMHLNRTCSLGMSIRLGFERKPEDGKVWRSGWHKQRIAAWLRKQPSCNKIMFPSQYNPPSEFKENPIPHNRYNASQAIQQRDCGQMSLGVVDFEDRPSKNGWVEIPVNKNSTDGSVIETCTICRSASR